MQGIINDIRSNLRMNSDRFTLSAHCSNQAYTPNEMWDFEKREPMPGFTYIGWCPSASTAKPESGWNGVEYHLAVMLEDRQGAEAWLHVPVTEEMINAYSERRFRQ